MGDHFLSAQRVCMTLGHVRHDKCLNLTKIASHMSNVPVVSWFFWSRSNSCPVCSYDSNVFPSFPTVLTMFHLFSHSKGLEKNKKMKHWTPKVEDAWRLVTFGKCVMCVFLMPAAPAQEMQQQKQI